MYGPSTTVRSRKVRLGSGSSGPPAKSRDSIMVSKFFSEISGMVVLPLFKDHALLIIIIYFSRALDLLCLFINCALTELVPVSGSNDNLTEPESDITIGP